MDKLQGPPILDDDRIEREEELRERRKRREEKRRKECEERMRREKRKVQNYYSGLYVDPYAQANGWMEAAGALGRWFGNWAGNKLADFAYGKPQPVYIAQPVQTAVAPYTDVSDEVVPVMKSSRQYDNQFSVNKHLMKLPNGKHASPEKVEMAEAAGFGTLQEGTTWVREHVKGGKKNG